MQRSAPKIALIHATPLAMTPVAQAFANLWPQARLSNLLDDSLSTDLAAAGGLSPPMVERVASLAAYVRRNGADGILFTCSSFGPAIDAAADLVRIPTLKPNEAMFEEALALCLQAGPVGRVGLVTTFAPAAQPMKAEFDEMVQQSGQQVVLDCACAEGAMALLQAGYANEHDRSVCSSALNLEQAHVLMLGQFSMARSLAAVHAATGKTVLTSPESAVRKLQRLLA